MIRASSDSGRVMFQSAPPVREATRAECGSGSPLAVSIRAPRAGGDAVILYHCQTTRNPSVCAKLLAKTGHSRGRPIVPAQFYHRIIALRQSRTFPRNRVCLGFARLGFKIPLAHLDRTMLSLPRALHARAS